VNRLYNAVSRMWRLLPDRFENGSSAEKTMRKGLSPVLIGS